MNHYLAVFSLHVMPADFFCASSCPASVSSDAMMTDSGCPSRSTPGGMLFQACQRRQAECVLCTGLTSGSFRGADDGETKTGQEGTFG